MGFLDWFFGGANFRIKTHGKVGEIISPAFNNTNGWFTRSRWDLVTKVNEEKLILDRMYIWDYSTVRALELRKILKGIKNG